ncbi:uncharacterized protein GGS25DRAFT_525157 [Hypoxylon fragiforme]|uniref:uncharacterized protein n=1 Tax=Hypoxylon fragiforme TaxID=63214 RepID=UPI0020C6A035|nr:uncharacterized protein GGS25DRAFT_525157 [Hypoxylon fragiforme]KAI2603883.1 hypothetical protein GGS25DRAFT_525157 [Hypoxylon fragiforme]
MPSPIRRELVKGKLQPPSQPPLRKSYTVTPTSINEVTVRHPSDKRVIQDPIEFSSVATAQPFVNPTVIVDRRRNNNDQA